MTCTAYFDNTVCHDNIDKYRSWCHDHGRILIKIREKYKSLERNIYNHDDSIEVLKQPCNLENLDSLTVTELNKKYVQLTKCIRLRKIFGQIGFSPELRDYRHEYWIYKLGEDLKLIECVLYNKYNTALECRKLENQEISEIPENQENQIKIKKDRSEKKIKKIQDDYESIIEKTELRFNDDIEKYGKKSWDDETIARYLYGFIIRGISDLTMNYCIDHFGEYALRLYTFATNYIECCCMICCINKKDPKDVETYSHAYTIEEICNDKKCSCFLLEHDDIRHQSLLYLYNSLQNYGSAFKLPSWILDMHQIDKTDGDISAPIGKCLEAAISDEGDINITMIYDRTRSLLTAGLGGIIHVKKHGKQCSCNSKLLIKINKEELLGDFPDIDNRKIRIKEEMRKQSKQIILDY